MKTAEEILNKSLRFNNDIPVKNNFMLKENIIEAMQTYASQALDECLKHERGDVVPESEILNVKYNLLK